MPSPQLPAGYTARNRRLNKIERQAVVPTRFASAVVKAAPAALPAVPPGPFGDVSNTSVEDLCAIVSEALAGMTTSTLAKRRAGIRTLFGHLAEQPGVTWQDRWDAAGFDGDGASIASLARPGVRMDRSNLTAAAGVAFGLRAIRPSLAGLRAIKLAFYPEAFRRLAQDSQLDDFFAAVQQNPRLTVVHRRRVTFDVVCALTTQGIALADLTPPALLHYALESKRLGLTVGTTGNTTRFAALAAWEALHAFGHFPVGTPATLRTYIYEGQLSIEQLVDRYDVRHPGIRQLLIDYLARRRTSADYTTIEGLARYLAGIFWATIERLEPGQDDLQLTPALYERWLAEIRHWSNDKTRQRKDPASILLAVRGFYVDLHSWAIEDRERWGRWSAPCPIRPQDLRGFGRRRREINQRMAERTRERQPLLATLVNHLQARRDRMAQLLETAAAVPLGASFEHGGVGYRRTDTREDRRDAADLRPPVRVDDLDAGRRINVTIAEDAAFWEWAAVEILRHSGIRIEELCELTHLSLRRYHRPNGELIALLVIAPSKTDRERVIPMSPDLLHTVAEVIRRHTSASGSVPLVSRYDPHERDWSQPLPYLMARQRGAVHGVIAPGTILSMLRRTCAEIATTNPAFRGLAFTPHDFRRLLATDLVNSGLPIHIGAALLGHLSLQTTQGYVAIFAEDLVAHYQRFFTHRRSLRPDTEYPDVTDDEWAEFTAHFDRRKVELGDCARPYGTPCQHEHACIRCPMLQVGAGTLPRLNEIETDLRARHRRATAENWLGEIDGIEHTLTLLHVKQTDARRQLERATGPSL